MVASPYPDTAFPLSAEPQEAAHLFEEFRRSYRDATNDDFDPDPNEAAFLKIFGNSHFLSRKLIAHPQMYDTFITDLFQNREKPLTVFANEWNAASRNITDKNTLISALKRFKYQEYLRLTIRELTLQNQNEIYREFSHLAGVLVRALAGFLMTEMTAKNRLRPNDVSDVAILAMGKLGGRELNYSSDIDLIGFYQKDGTCSDATQHEFFVKIFTRLGTLLQDADAEGFLYRVDWDLRPEGKSGTLANSFAALENYYETFGQEWERQAFIKASVLYQTGNIGDKFLQSIAPFTYRKYWDEKNLHLIRDMKSHIIDSLNRKPRAGLNIKLDHGGIRDVEFVVQGLQLLHGGKNPDLRIAHTDEAIARLKKHGFLESHQADTLRDGYFFLRRLESALQMDEERQTHVLKNHPEERLKMARRLGFRQETRTALDAFNKQLENTTKLIHDIFKEFYPA